MTRKITKTTLLIRSARCAALALLLSAVAPGMAQFVPEASRAELTAAAEGNRRTGNWWIFTTCEDDPCPGRGEYCCGTSRA